MPERTGHQPCSRGVSRNHSQSLACTRDGPRALRRRAFEITPRPARRRPRRVPRVVPRGRVHPRPPGTRFHLRAGELLGLGRRHLRGIHFAELPPSQAKFVTCVARCSARRGRRPARRLADLRPVGLGAARRPDRRAVYLPEGSGHAFMALEDHTVVSYLCSAPYAPGREHGIHPLDPAIGIDWPTTAGTGADSRRCSPPRTPPPHPGRDPRARRPPDVRRGAGLIIDS